MGWLPSPAFVRTERLPFLRRKDVRQPQAGKHDQSPWHARDAGDESRDRRCDSRDARRDREAARRIILPAPRKAVQQSITVLCKIHRPLLGEYLRPGLVDEFEP